MVSGGRFVMEGRVGIVAASHPAVRGLGSVGWGKAVLLQVREGGAFNRVILSFDCYCGV